jgi:DNA-binding transcriptional LysR family regulator
MPDLRSLEIFYWNARLRSFRSAAERLNTTQPAVSQRVAALEAECGCRLLERGPGGVAPTAQGRRLVEFAERMLRLRAEMLEAVGGPDRMTGTLRIGVAETIVHTWLGRFLERAHAALPNVTLDIEVDVTRSLRAGLVEHSLDLAFLMGPIADPSIVNLPLCRYALTFCASPRLDLASGPLSRAALLGRPIITYPRNTRPTAELIEALRGPELPPPRIFGSASLATILRMAADGIGIALVPPAVAGRELAEGVLRLVETEVAPLGLAFTVSFPAGPEDGLARRLAGLAVEVAAAERPSDKPALSRRIQNHDLRASTAASSSLQRDR